MANHAARGVQAPPPPAESLPEVRWVSIVQSPQGWHAALMVTQGDRILRRELSAPEREKRYAESAFRLLALDNVTGWTT